MRFLKQFGMLLRMNLLGLPQRAGLACTTVIGVTCAVGVLVSMLAMGVGARRQLMGNVRPDRASLLSVGALQPAQSSITKDTAVEIEDLPGIRRNARGQPIAVPQVFVATQARAKGSEHRVGFPIVGNGAGFLDYAAELHLTAGRMFRPGLHELIASNYCARRYENFAVGDKRVIQGGEWVVVGNFDLGHMDGTCVVYTDADTVMSAFGRPTYNDVDVVLQSPGAFTVLVNAIKANPLLHVVARREADLQEQSARQVDGILNFVAYFIGSILAIAATIGAANSLYAVVDSRRRELATLRAVGFGGAPVVASTLSEAVVLAIPGALIGVGLAWLLFNGRAASSFGFQFHLAVTAPLALAGIAWALIMGVIGGLAPAVRAVRVPVTVALRAM